MRKRDYARQPFYLYPGSALFFDWDGFYAEIGRWLVERRGIPATSALGAVLAAQSAVMPRALARYPRRQALAHDVAAWRAELRRGVLGGEGPSRTLSEHGPAILTVEDPLGMSYLPLLGPLQISYDYHRLQWELSSALLDEAYRPNRLFVPERLALPALLRSARRLGSIGADHAARLVDSHINGVGRGLFSMAGKVGSERVRDDDVKRRPDKAAES
jgi:hypothetical protein